MSKEIVKYHNDLNEVKLKKFNARELDVFMEICSRLREKRTDKVIFDFWYLKQLINWKDTASCSFAKTLENMYDKLMNLRYKVEIEPSVIDYFVLFNHFRTNLKNQTIEIQVNSMFAYILNDLTKNFTRFELEEFVNFKSKYSKNFFRVMRQFSFGFWEIELNEFKEILDIPYSYKICDIDKFVLKPIQNELKDKYNLKIIKNFDKKSLRGRPKLVGYRFEFKTDVSSSNATKEKIKNYQIGKYNFKKYVESETWLLITSKKNKDYESLSKIVDIYLQNGKIKMDMFGAFSHENQTHTFESEKHLMNFIEKFRYKKDK